VCATVGRPPCYRRNGSILARLFRAENALASRGDRVPRPGCAAPWLRASRPPPSNAAPIPASRPPRCQSRAGFRRPCAASRFRPVGGSTAPPDSGNGSRRPLSIYRKPRPGCARPGCAALVAPRPGCAIIERRALVAPWLRRRIPANIGTPPPSASRPPFDRSRPGCALVAPPVRHHRRKRGVNARRCVRPRRTDSRPSRRAAPLQARFKPPESVRQSRADSGKPSAALVAPPPSNTPRPGCALVAPPWLRASRPPLSNAAPWLRRPGCAAPVYPATVRRVPRPACQRFRRTSERRRHRKRRPFDRAGSVRAGFRPMSADLVHRVRNRWPSALLSPQRFDSRPPISRRKRPCKPWRPCAAPWLRRPGCALVAPRPGCGQAVRHHRTPRPGCAAPVYPASRGDRVPPVSDSGEHRTRRHHRKRATVRPCRKCAAGFRQKETPRPISERGAIYPATVRRRFRR